MRALVRGLRVYFLVQYEPTGTSTGTSTVALLALVEYQIYPLRTRYWYQLIYVQQSYRMSLKSIILGNRSIIHSQFITLGSTKKVPMDDELS